MRKCEHVNIRTGPLVRLFLNIFLAFITFITINGCAWASVVN